MRLSKIKNKQKYIPVILGGGINAFGIARSFREAGIYSIIMESCKNFSFYSSSVNGVICPDPIMQAEFAGFLVDFAQKLDYPGIIFTTNDKWLLPVCRYRKKLEKHYLFPMSPPDVIEAYADKKKLYEIAEKIKLDYPGTFNISCISKLTDIIDKINFPCILKPGTTLEFAEKLNIRKRVINIHNKEELIFWGNKIKKAGLENKHFMIQEYIPGGAENLYTITTYSDKNGNIEAYSTGHKLRQRPPDAGTIISGKVIPEPRLYEPVQKLLKYLNFYGIANTEFKYDKRDKKFKLIEINPRPGKWNYSITATGINMPLMAYNEILGIEYSNKFNSEDQIVWLCFVEDFYNTVLGGFKKKGYPEFSLSIKQYFKSIKGKKIDAVFTLKDIRAGFMYLFYLVFNPGK